MMPNSHTIQATIMNLNFLIDSLSPLRMFFTVSVNVSNELGMIQTLGSS